MDGQGSSSCQHLHQSSVTDMWMTSGEHADTCTGLHSISPTTNTIRTYPEHGSFTSATCQPLASAFQLSSGMPRRATHEENDEDLQGLVVQFDNTSPANSKTSELGTSPEMSGQPAAMSDPLSHTQPSAWIETPLAQAAPYGVTNSEDLSQQHSHGWVNLGSALERWQRLGSALGMTSGENLANFLLQHYEDISARKQSHSHCHASPILLCGECDWTAHLPNSKSPDIALTLSEVFKSSTEELAGTTGRAEATLDHTQSSVNRPTPESACISNVQESQRVNPISPTAPSTLSSGGHCGANLVTQTDTTSPAEQNSHPACLAEESPVDSSHAENSDLPASSQKCFVCQICQRACVDAELLTLHLQRHMDDVFKKCHLSRMKAGLTTTSSTASPKIQWLCTRTQAKDEALMDSQSKCSPVNSRGQRKGRGIQTRKLQCSAWKSKENDVSLSADGTEKNLSTTERECLVGTSSSVKCGSSVSLAGKRKKTDASPSTEATTGVSVSSSNDDSKKRRRGVCKKSSEDCVHKRSSVGTRSSVKCRPELLSSGPYSTEDVIPTASMKSGTQDVEGEGQTVSVKTEKETMQKKRGFSVKRWMQERVEGQVTVKKEPETPPKRRGFSAKRWMQERGEGLVAGQPTRCTQTAASDPLLPFVCLECDEKFEHEHKLINHRRKHSGERPFQCSECSASFAQTSHLKQHLRTHSGEKPYACPHCPARFARTGSLSSHLNTHTGCKPFQCEHCPATFSHRTTLKSHMKVHTGIRPYLCPECGRTFAHTSNLKKHRVTHTGLRPYICHLCSKAFTDPVNLKRHIRTHSGIKPFKCDQCLKAFGTSDALKVHMRTHTGERPFACQHCVKAFTTFQSLRKHIGTQHALSVDMA